jgi:hypothetical protein
MSQGDGDRREKSARLIANALAMTGRFLPLLCGFTVVLVISGCTGRPASDPLRRIDMLERAERAAARSEHASEQAQAAAVRAEEAATRADEVVRRNDIMMVRPVMKHDR